MGSPLGPVLAGIFMVHLERTLSPTLNKHMNPWKRYVDDTVSIIKETSIAYVVFLAHFVDDFSRKIFLILHSITSRTYIKS